MLTRSAGADPAQSIAGPPAELLPPLDPILVLTHYPLPSPNGYNVLERLAKQINSTREPRGALDKAGHRVMPTPEEYRAALPLQLEDNRAVLDELRPALQMEWVYPHPPAPDILFRQAREVRYAARLVVAEAEMLVEKGQPQEARAELLDVLKLSVVLPRGGAEIHWLVGASLQNMALRSLRRMVAHHKFSEPLLRDLRTRLSQLERDQVPLRETIAFEYEAQGPQTLTLSAPKFWELMGGAPGGPLVEVLELPGADQAAREFAARLLPQLMTWDAKIARLAAQPYYAIRDRIPERPKDLPEYGQAVVLCPVEANVLKKQAQALCQWRAARIMIALELYRTACGAYPDRLRLVAPPPTEDAVDPFSGRPFTYLKKGQTYVLYSTGPDGKNHGGRGGVTATPGMDYLIWPDP